MPTRRCSSTPMLLAGRAPRSTQIANSSAAEQSFAFVKKIAASARRMTPSRGFTFLLCLLHERNLCLERRGQLTKAVRARKRRFFHDRRRFQEQSETLPLCHRAVGGGGGGAQPPPPLCNHSAHAMGFNKIHRLRSTLCPKHPLPEAPFARLKKTGLPFATAMLT